MPEQRSDGKLEIKASELTPWEPKPVGKNGYFMIKLDGSDGNEIAMVLPEREALIAAAGPALLRWLAPIARRPGAPLHVDLVRVLASLNINLT